MRANNSDNRVYGEHYEDGAGIIFDIHSSQQGYYYLKELVAGDTLKVLTRSKRNCDNVVITTYSVTGIDERTSLEDGSINTVVLGSRITETGALTKVQASRIVPELFTETYGIKRGVNALPKHP